MFKFKCSSCESQKWSDGSEHFKVWFTTPKGGQAWLWSSKAYEAGAEVPIVLTTIQSEDRKVNGKLGLVIAN